jgi:uncharacterized RDD family membrane protein YckC
MNDHLNTPDNPYLAPKATVADVASGEIELAERTTRLGASIIDGLVQLAVILIILFPILNRRGLEGFSVLFYENVLLSSVLSVIVGFAVYSAVNFHLLRKNGQTIGKYVCKIKIVRSDGSPADVPRILLFRFLPMLVIPQVPLIGNIIGLINPLLIFRESRKCLHDNIADTIVIKA